MRRERVHPTYTDAEFAELYGLPWQQAEPWHPHLINCPNPWVAWELTIAMGKGFGRVSSIADLSCGDGTVAKALADTWQAKLLLGDYAPGYKIQGPISETIHQIPMVDLFVCTNTIEHLEEPDRDLALIRQHCRGLLLSAPLEEWEEPSSGHYWAWDREAVEEMVVKAGFAVSGFVYVDLTPFWEPHVKHGIWACR